MRICIFGSSSLNLNRIYIDAVYELGKRMGERGHELVFGGYDMGLMGAAAAGTQAGGGRVLGVVTEGLNNKDDRSIFPCDEVVCTADLAERKALMMERADAFITTPGGIGTFDEFFDVVSLAKAGEAHYPCAIFNVAGYFNPLIQMLDEACEKGLNSTDWHEHAQVFDDADALIAYLESCQVAD